MDLKFLLLLTVGHLMADVNTGALPAYLPFLKDSLGLTYTLTAAITLCFNMTSSVIQPVFGYFSDRWSISWLLPSGCFTASLGLGLIGLGPSYGWILFLAGLSGLGQASYHPEAFKIINLLSGRNKASMIGIFLVGGNLGLAIGPFLATLYYSYFGLKGSLLFIPAGIAMTLLFFAVPGWKKKNGGPLSTGPFGAEKASAPRRPIRPMLFLIMTVVLRTASRLALLTFIPFHFISVLHEDPMKAGQYLSLFLLAGSVGVLAGGSLADRYGYKRMTILGLFLTSGFLYLFFYSTGLWSLVFFTLAGLVSNSSNSITMAMGQSFMSRKLGMASGLILGLATGLGGICTTLLGWVADHFGVPFVMQIIFLLPLLALLAFLFVPYPLRPGRISGRESALSFPGPGGPERP